MGLLSGAGPRRRASPGGVGCAFRRARDLGQQGLSPGDKGRPRPAVSDTRAREGGALDVRPLTSPKPWVQRALSEFSGNLVCCRIGFAANALNVVSVYSPAWPVSRERLEAVDTSGVQLALNPDVWLSDILLAALRAIDGLQSGLWIVGGDFNSSETFDLKDGYRGNREYLERMAAFGLTECLRHSMGALTPTFRNTRGGKHRSPDGPSLCVGSSERPAGVLLHGAFGARLRCRP